MVSSKPMGMWRSLCIPLKPVTRAFSCGPVCRAGSQWRLEHGLSRSGTEYGPLTDLPDWSFADGRPAPPMKGYIRRRQEAAQMAGRIVMLTNELQRGIEQWESEQAVLRRQQEEQLKSQLRPKGARARHHAPQVHTARDTHSE
ncbi:39S ribosomal protein L52, mitochondrial isoform X2 [Hypanus sabinus]|uniref:39S ribosomal protein L52, mitochondrial isoform X2 n=1 Tax=Hypanus sabinus TaxID=79690 RepID=UPI0028C4F9F4|nr:39S ribosomal protein L52, mitochondrial isoform X2 [Hypanus sabinus]